jgi:hypothetical protein
VQRFTAEVTLDVEVEIVDASRGRRGRYSDRPEESAPDEPEQVTLAVRFGTLDLTTTLPADVLDALTTEALERLHEAATEP